MSLEGSIVLVTGAARGIGRAIAERLASRGADLALADVRDSQLAETAGAIEALGRQALALAVDVTQREQVEEMVERVVERFGRIDVFFNNAGIIEIEDFLHAEEDTWDRIMAVNAKGVFLCGQAVGRQMVAQRDGKIVNTASIAAQLGIPDMAAYAASKAAVISLTHSMALALGPLGVTVNALAPGIVETDMWDLIDERRAAIQGLAPGEPRRARVSTIPLGRAASADDVAAVAEFLASDGSDYLTGQTLNVDGGQVPA